MRKHLDIKAPWRFSLILCLLATLSACGQKGPLYLPEPEPEPREENR